MPVAVTRQVSRAIAYCELTYLARDPIDPDRARSQHRAYEQCLGDLGWRVLSLPEEPDLPDSVFVEDTAIVLHDLAIMTRPGAPSRRPETASVERVLGTFRPLARMEYPATLDGGDVLRIGARLYVGASSRSNSPGIGQLRALVAPHGISVTPLLIRNCLHLKSAVTLVAPDSVLLNPAWVDRNNFPGMRVIEVSPTEPHAANALLLGDTVVYPTTFPDTADRLEQAGIRLRTVDVSELAKAEGGVTCSCLLVEE